MSCNSLVRVRRLTLAPLVMKVDPNVNVVLTACLTVYVGCYRSVKPTPPSLLNPFAYTVLLWNVQETMSSEHAMLYMLQEQEAHVVEFERMFIAIKPDGVQRGLGAITKQMTAIEEMVASEYN
uniref:Uncharacterized protein n=1 Tax=Cucumis melo TaxID=3656 RepID=A0A9I9EIM8_CUCME